MTEVLVRGSLEEVASGQRVIESTCKITGRAPRGSMVE